MRRAILAFVATVAGLVVVLSFKTAGTRSTDRSVALSGATPAQPSPDDGVAGPPSAQPTQQPGSPPQAGDPSASAPPTPAKTSASAGAQTVTGTSVRVSEGFRTFGSVQVRVTLANGKITKLVAVDYPNRDPRSAEISQYSIPVLAQEVLQAQGTNIDVVSGATYTTQAYAESVQAALDKAKS